MDRGERREERGERIERRDGERREERGERIVERERGEWIVDSR